MFSISRRATRGSGIGAYVLNVVSGSLPLPRPLAHYVRSLGLRRAVGSLSHDADPFFFALELSVVAVLMGSCDMLDGGRSEGTATIHPSQ